MKKLVVFCLLFFIAGSCLWGQDKSNIKRDTTKGFDFFFNPGMYFGHKKNANYYRGMPSAMESDYANPDIQYVLRNPYWRIDIMRLIIDNYRNVVADTFWLKQPSGMRYTANLSFGIGARYRFTKNLSIGVSFTQARMTAHGYAYLGVKIMDFNSDDEIKCLLVGKERRNSFELIANYVFSQGIVSPFLEAGMHVNNTKVISSDLVVEDVPFSMLNMYGQGVVYDPTMPPTRIDRKLGGVGYGFSAALGLRISFNRWAAIEPVAQFRLEKVNLAGYNDITPNFNIMIRLVLGDKVFAKTGGEK